MNAVLVRCLGGCDRWVPRNLSLDHGICGRCWEMKTRGAEPVLSARAAVVATVVLLGLLVVMLLLQVPLGLGVGAAQTGDQLTVSHANLRGVGSAQILVCSIDPNGRYHRGLSFVDLSCQDYYARIIGLAGSGAKGEYAGWLYFCWALDPCGWPK